MRNFKNTKHYTKLYTFLFTKFFNTFFKTIHNSTTLYNTFFKLFYTRLYKTWQNFTTLDTVHKTLQNYTKLFIILHRFTTLYHFTKLFTKHVHNYAQLCTSLHKSANILQHFFFTTEATSTIIVQTHSKLLKHFTTLYKTLHNFTKRCTTIHNITNITNFTNNANIKNTFTTCIKHYTKSLATLYKQTFFKSKQTWPILTKTL